MLRRNLLISISLLSLVHWGIASSILPTSKAGLLKASEAVHRGTVIGQTSFVSGEDPTDQARKPIICAERNDAGTSQLAGGPTGLLQDSNGNPSRFIAPDRGEPIPYLIDADSLPAGISLTAATNAVSQALHAWTAVTSLKFKFEGRQSFGVAANTIANEDGRLRIQLHDNYNAIHEDGRGATLGAYDPPVIQKAYPLNPPPYTFDRVLDVVTAPVTPNVTGINEIELRGYDLQQDPLTLSITTPAGGNGTWSQV